MFGPRWLDLNPTGTLMVRGTDPGGEAVPCSYSLILICSFTVNKYVIFF